MFCECSRVALFSSMFSVTRFLLCSCLFGKGNCMVMFLSSRGFVFVR